LSATVDTNVLLYASDAASTFHERARELVGTFARGPDLVYLFWPVLTAYLRVATHPAVFERPLAPKTAEANVDNLLALPHVRSPSEDEDFWAGYRAVTAGLVVRGNLVPDAHLVALMRQYGVETIWSHDRDFRKFEGISVRDPFD
jgi:toxin-antitoxin system PIN domain toxin